MNPTERRIPKRWTEEEDKILHDETQKQAATGNIKDWHRIAAKLPGRTNKDCRKRWVNKVCGSLKKGAWNDDEDERLVNAIEKHGQKWTLVANDVGFRSPDQCAKRWQSNLDPTLEHGGWTTEEDELLLSMVRKNGRDWKMIHEQSFSRRSLNELKNRYTGLSKRSKPSYSRAKSPSSCSVSSSFNSELQADMGNRRHVAGAKETSKGSNETRENPATGFISPQSMTEDWVSMLENPNMWVDDFQGQTTDIGGGLPGLMDLDNLDTQQGQVKSSTLISTESAMSVDASGWPGLLYDAGLTLPGIDDQMSIDPQAILQSNHLLPEDFFELHSSNENGLETLEVHTHHEHDHVGRVSLVIDKCNRDTLHHLLKLRGRLNGKTRIEIHNEE
ncbi:hypothetical protein F4818DRAFT_422995 [Hypoxylon cercidicola]|nr:hypothetical protein F4818DRAFT_422995 [Hypoxylon cercidicola]